MRKTIVYWNRLLQQFKKQGVYVAQTKVDEILTESRGIVIEDFFKEHERDHFQGRINTIDKRNKALEDKAAKEERRYECFAPGSGCSILD